MKLPDAYAEWTVSGYLGKFRPCWKASHWDVKQHDARGRLVTAYFPNAAAAELAAWKELRRVELPIMTRDGEVIAVTKKADQMFPGLRPSRKSMASQHRRRA